MVSVIAAFKALLSRLKTCPLNGVAAGGSPARVGACVGVDDIPVITILFVIDAAVTADFREAVARAAVPGEFIGVVAFFVSFIFGAQVVAPQPVTAGR